jgi:digeranylgeranylglycerophospholipid reductase
MKIVSDVAVVGGGPCGSFAALELSKSGVNVTVFEEHSEIGVPSHCSGHLSIKSLKNLGFYPLPEKIVENVFYGANFYSPKGTKFSVRFPSPVTCTVNRAFFDNYIAEMAKASGAKYHLNARVESLYIENGFVRGVNIRQNKTEKKLAAKIVVDAEGTSSRILRQAGLTPLNRDKLVYAVQAEVEDVKDTEQGILEVFLGNAYAPGFFAWLIPKRHGTARVGLAAKTGNPKELLSRLMQNHPIASNQLRTARVLRTVFHPITLGGPIPKTYSNGFLAVGDVASQVKPTTGGGVILGMTCARVAAEVVYEALQRNDLSSEFLRLYQERCRKIMGFDVNVMRRIRFMLDGLSDEKLEEFIRVCTKLGLAGTLQKIEEIDFQGRALLRTLQSSSMLATLVYLFFLYFSGFPNVLRQMHSI